MLVLGGGASGAYYVYDHQEDYALALRDEAGRVVDNVTRQLATSAFRFVDARATVRDGFLSTIEVTLQLREAEEVRVLETSLVVVHGANERALPANGSQPSSWGLEPVRDVDASLTAGTVSAGDLVLLRLDIAGLGERVGPRDLVRLSLRTLDAPPLVLELRTPTFFSGASTSLDATVK